MSRPDPNIALQLLQRPERPDLIQRMGQLAEMKQQRILGEQQQQLNDMAIRSGQRQEQTDLETQDRIRKVTAIIGQNGTLEEKVNALKTIDPGFAQTYATQHVEIDKKLNEGRRQNIDLIRNIAARASMAEDPNQALDIWNTGTNLVRSLGMGDLVDKLDQARGTYPADKQYFESILGTLQEAEDQLRLGETERHNRATEANQQLTADEKDFQSFYPSWLESNNLNKSARNEVAARQAFRRMGDQPGFQEQEAGLVEAAYAERLGKSVEALSATERIEARRWHARLTPQQRTEFDKRLELYREDPDTYNALYGRGGQEEPGAMDITGIVQRMITAARDPLTGGINPETYERQRVTLSRTLGVELPKLGENGEPTPAPTSRPSPEIRPDRRYNLGSVVIGDDKKQYRVVGFADDGEPLVEEVR